MRFYNIEMKGKFIVEKRTSLPSHSGEDEGRLLYYNNNLYVGDSTSYVSAGGECSACAGNAACLDGQDGAYYLCANNATGALPVTHGGTGGVTAAYARCNLEICGTSNTTHYHDSRYFTQAESNSCYGRLICGNTWSNYQCWTGLTRFYNTTCFMDAVYACGQNTAYTSAMYVCPQHACEHGITITTNDALPIISCSQADTAGRFHGAVFGACFYGSVGICAFGCGTLAAICANSDTAGSVIRATHCSSGRGIYACSCIGEASCFSGRDIAVRGHSSVCYGIYGWSTTSAAVAGNTAYCQVSSKYIKYLNDVCLSNCLRENPLSIYKYYWEDSNNKGFNMTVGPTAECFNKTFNLLDPNGDNYDGIWSMDGIAFGLGVENLKEIDKLKKIVIELYSCIQKLEGSEG